ncbi:hypothetical protein SOASR030_11370 [Leminorella grimontii]|uniref:WG repeat-containing protein n=1 Tax=Leminorella grimontii TaxID=82981 RepID=A0AAV5N0J5_9GAMM|nr:hypothetical protein [Leminorella grimontii]KFC97612.1 hypothetical protein GLGR_0547 [Leminorella grimontii ATCC 33999 = DSM 5078]GKX55025.1 hypothetical protein SOASR030_11370 [Leminorella grimontii]VFS57024.1 Uncharacterised protein [Leminorella grimontii]
MRKLIGVLIIAVLLSGCDNKDKPHEGYYLTDDIQIEFDNSDVKPQDNRVVRPEQQRQIAQEIKKQNSKNYFNFTPSTVTYYTPFSSSVKNIQNGRVQLDDIDYTIAQGEGRTLRLLSDKGIDCSYHACQITITLKKVREDSSELIKRQEQQKKSESAYRAQMSRNIDYFKHPSLDDFIGVPLSLGKPFAIKIPIDMYNQFVDRTPADCTRNCNLNAFPLASQDDGETSIFTYYSKQEKHGGTLYIFNGKPGDVTLEERLKKQTPILLQTENGAVYYNTQGELEAFYFQYDEASKRYFVGVANAATAEQIAREFTVLRTMDPRYRGKKTVSMADLQLSQQALEEKYQAKVSDYFDTAKVQKAIWDAVELMVHKPERFFNPNGMIAAPVWFPSENSNQDIYVQLYAQSIDSLMKDEEQIGINSKYTPKGKRMGNFLVYTDRRLVSYYYLIKVDDRLTLVLGVGSGDKREKLLLAQVFKQLDLSTIPTTTIPAEERKNLFKYESLHDRYARSDDRYFTVGEGLIDNHGNLIIAQPENGRYRFFSEQPPFIFAPLEDKEREAMGWSLFNEQGKLLLHSKELHDEIIDQHLAMAGDKEKYGIFDLDAQKWLLPPTYKRIDWQKSAFVVADAEEKQYLLDKEGNVLTSAAKMIYITDDKNHFAVIGNNGELSLVNERGQTLFQHRGKSLKYIAQIDAWLIVVPDETGEDELMGVISEQGEMIIPAKYYGYRVIGDNLQMLQPGGKRPIFYNLAQVKDWKNHQPLQEVSVR